MYILKNAWRNVIRSKGRSILVGVIILAIALSSCLALSIRAAAEQTRKSALGAMNITAAISVCSFANPGGFPAGAGGRTQ